MNTQVKARQAATVILLRASEPKGFEVFLTQRPDSMPFLGGKYCYPGGSVIKEDCSPPATARCTGLSPDQARKIVGAHFSPRQALGFWIAAIRELFEEVGILLAMKKMRIEKGKETYLERSYQLYASQYIENVPAPSVNGAKTVLEFLVKDFPKAKTADANSFIDNSLIKPLEESGFIKALYQ